MYVSNKDQYRKKNKLLDTIIYILDKLYIRKTIYYKNYILEKLYITRIMHLSYSNILVIIAILSAIYIYMCYLDESKYNDESFENNDQRDIWDKDNNKDNNKDNDKDQGDIWDKLEPSVFEIVVIDRLFPDSPQPIPLSYTSSNPAQYSNLDTSIKLEVVVKNTPAIMNNVIVTFTDVKQKQPAIRVPFSKWQSIKSDAKYKTETFTISQYLEPNTTYRINIKADGINLKGKGLEDPIHVGDQTFRVLGVETEQVAHDTSTDRNGPLDGNMGLAVIVQSSSQPGQQLQEMIYPGGYVVLDQIQMTPYNQIILYIRIPDISIFQSLIQRLSTTYTENNNIIDGIGDYKLWKLDVSVMPFTDDGLRALTEEEIKINSKILPQVRIEASNPTVCVNPETNPNGPCQVKLIGVYPGKYYEIKIQGIYNKLHSNNNYRRTHPLTIKLQAIDATGSASLLSYKQAAGSPPGIADAIKDIGIQIRQFNDRQFDQDKSIDELDKMYNGIQFK